MVTDSTPRRAGSRGKSWSTRPAGVSTTRRVLKNGKDAAAFERPGDKKIVTALGESSGAKTSGESPAGGTHVRHGLAPSNRSHPLKKGRQREDLYGIVVKLANDLTDAARCT